MAIELDSEVQYLKGVGPARADDFARLGVNTVRDLLFTFPRDITDRSNVSAIAAAPREGEAVVLASVIHCEERRLFRGRLRHVVSATLSDGTGTLEAVWYNSPWVMEKIPGATLLLYGKVKYSAGNLRMEHPSFELAGQGLEERGSLNAGRMVPVYPCTGKLNQNAWRKVMHAALEQALTLVPELYPPDYLRGRGLLARQEAVRNMHFPADEATRQEAWRRLAYDECLMLQLVLGARRREFSAHGTGRSFRITRELERRITRLFPFRLTPAQERVIAEIMQDLQRPQPMHRLLQGDVGSGKTAVAVYAMLAVVGNGAQVCLMAPTGLLARQHYQTLTEFLANSERSKVRVALLPGGMKKRERELLRAELSSGGIDILIATHAALQDDIEFADLGLVVIDEQHKFGVSQRGALVAKGSNPDTLVMTATPIPRSLALTVYGDLEVSVIDALPPGRKPVKTSAPAANLEPKVWEFLRRELARGRQAYVVSPVLEENEESDLVSAREAYERLCREEFPNFRVGLMHGKMSREEQQELMKRFRAREVDLLVSTVVIEVGVDVPNANTMVILHAERFGLAQLHQLRGRIGRGGEQGHFIMLSAAKGEIARQRLLILCQSCDGFKIAEEDLRLRGPGEFLGTRQHGLPELKLVDIVENLDMLLKAREEARELLPELASPRFAELSAEIRRRYRDTFPATG